MTDATQDIVARAEALLAGVTPGVWEWSMNGDDYDSLYTDTMPESNSIEGIKRVIEPWSAEMPWVSAWANIANPADAAFIAAAPALVRDLVAEVTRLRAIGDESEGGDE